MSIRAVIIGLCLAAGIGGVGYLNDWVMHLTPLVGNHLPIGVVGLLLLLVLVINPLAGLIRASWRLRAGELAVIAALTLAACAIPSSGLMRTFVPTLAMPARYNTQYPSWQSNGVIAYVPAKLLPAGGEDDPHTLNPLITSGLGRPGKPISLDAVPWSSWQTPLSNWLPLIVLFALAVICVALIVHPQWSARERLRYPVARFIGSLLGDDATGQTPILRRSGFWIALGVVAAIHSVNGLSAWHVLNVQIPLTLDLQTLAGQYPKLASAPGAERFFSPQLYLAVVGFSFFLASDVGLSLGICQFLFVGAMALFMQAGVNYQTSYLTGGEVAWQYFGSYLGLGMIVAYAGRWYYWATLKEAVTFRPQAGVHGYSAWAARFLILIVAGLVALICRLGLPWYLAAIFVALVLLMFTVMTRVNAESGLFFIQPSWQPLAVFIGLFGASSLGPSIYTTIGLLCAVLTIDPRECLMPFVVNGLKLCEDKGVRPSRAGAWIPIAVLAALAVAVPVVLWADYNWGLPSDGWATLFVPKMPFDAAGREFGKMDPAQLAQAASLSGLERLAEMRPSGAFLAWAGGGLALVLAFNVLRMRLTWWPLHPILFLVWGTYPMGHFSWSFLVGWAVKAMITRFGGPGTYDRAKGVMIGLIAGEVLAGVGFMIAGAIYYALRGLPPPSYSIFPG